MLKRYPSLQSMRAFLQAAEAGSFSQAARQLNLTHSAISQQIGGLETFIGQALFIREGGGVSLTSAGRRFAGALSTGLAQIDQALEAVRQADDPPPLRLNVDSELAHVWLNARLPQLLDMLPGQRLSIQSDAESDPRALERADLSLRYGYGEWSGCEVEQICDDQVIAIASPAFARRWNLDATSTPAQLLEAPLLGYTKRSWGLWLGAAHLQPEEPSACLLFDNVTDLIAAAEAGLGAGLSRRLLVADALQAGRLIMLTGIVIPTHYNLYAIWPHGCGERAAPVIQAIKALGRACLDNTAPPGAPGPTDMMAAS